MPASLTEDGFLGGRLRILQPEKGFRAGIDSVFLAAAVPCAAGETVFEAGIGTGVAALCLLARNPAIHLTGIELAARYAHAVRGERQAQRLRGQSPGDPGRREGRAPQGCWPPCRRPAPSAMPWPIRPIHEEGKSTPSPNLLKAQAHAFGPDDLELWVKVLHAMVALRGTVTLVHRAEMLGKLLQLMEDRFGDIRVAPLYPAQGAAASRVIVQGVKGSKAPMQLLPGLVLHDQSRPLHARGRGRAARRRGLARCAEAC